MSVKEQLIYNIFTMCVVFCLAAAADVIKTVENSFSVLSQQWNKHRGCSWYQNVAHLSVNLLDLQSYI